MSLLAAAALARLGAGPAPAPVSDPEASSVPYAMPSSYPYNAPTYAITPTPDGTGSLLHPDVIDFKASHGMDQWNGYRYWMFVTPWYRQYDPKELPCLLASHDAFNWEVPPGVVNPLFRPQAALGDSNYLPDTDMVYDPDTGTLHGYFLGGRGLFHTSTRDGITWTGRQKLWPRTDEAVPLTSPAVVRIATGAWMMFMGDGKKDAWAYRAPAADGPWEQLGKCVISGISKMWHLDVIWTGSRFWALIDRDRDAQVPAVSRDGLTWTSGPSPLPLGSGRWDSQWQYRSTLQPHPEGDKVRVWYSGHPAEDPATTTQSWRVGYTHVPASYWARLGG